VLATLIRRQGAIRGFYYRSREKMFDVAVCFQFGGSKDDCPLFAGEAKQDFRVPCALNGGHGGLFLSVKLKGILFARIGLPR
jgi:hypothetical protein